MGKSRTLWQLGRLGWLMALVGLMLAAGCQVTRATSAPTTMATEPSTTEPTTTTIAPPPLPTPPPAPPTPTPASAPAPVSAALPNPALTPGEALPGISAAQVCQPGWASSHRDVPEAERHAVFAAYGVPYEQRAGYELDHLIPLELGGDNAQANLWPQPHDRAGGPGSQTKDGLENRLHELVCAGMIDVVTARHAIATNWFAALERYGASS